MDLFLTESNQMDPGFYGRIFLAAIFLFLFFYFSLFIVMQIVIYQYPFFHLHSSFYKLKAHKILVLRYIVMRSDVEFVYLLSNSKVRFNAFTYIYTPFFFFLKPYVCFFSYLRFFVRILNLREKQIICNKTCLVNNLKLLYCMEYGFVCLCSVRLGEVGSRVNNPSHT
jgi:hypothetical protein